MNGNPIELVAHTATARSDLLLELNEKLRRERERLVGLAVDRLVAQPQVWRDLRSRLEASTTTPIPQTLSRLAGLELHPNRHLPGDIILLFSGDEVVGIIRLGERVEPVPSSPAQET